MRDESDALLDAALRVLRSRPDATTTEIAGAAGISRATLHRRYARREELVGALARKAVTDVRRALERSAAAEGAPLAALVHEILPVAYDFGFLARVPDEAIAGAEATWQELYDGLTEVMALLQRRRLLRADVPPAWLTTALISLLSGVADAVADGSVAPRDAERLVLTTFAEGLAGRYRGDGPDGRSR